MKHIKLFESMGDEMQPNTNYQQPVVNPRGLGEIEIEPGLGMVIYNGNDIDFMKREYELFSPDKTFEEFVEELRTPGVYGADQYGGPWKIIKIELGEFSEENNIYGMLYRF